MTAAARHGVFVSYAHEDEYLVSRLRVHLRRLEANGLAEVWDDSEIRPGQEWRKEIQQGLETTRVAVLIVSADFLNSEFICHEELPFLLQAADTEKIDIIPVAVTQGAFRGTPSLCRFQSINPPEHPLTDMTEAQRERLWDELTDKIAQILAPSPKRRRRWLFAGNRQRGSSVVPRNSWRLAFLLLALLTSVLLALLAWQYRLAADLQASLHDSMLPAGWYGEPKGLMTTVLSQVKQAKEASGNVFIVADLASFGSLTHNGEYRDYELAVQELGSAVKADRARSAKAVFYTADMVHKWTSRQFKKEDWPAWLEKSQNRNKLKSWFETPSVKEAMLDKHLLTPEQLMLIRRGDLSAIDLDLFIKCLVAHNDYVIDLFEHSGITVRRYPDDLCFHLWLNKESTGIVGVVDVANIVGEPGFKVGAEGRLDDIFWNFATEIYDQARL